MGYRHRPLSARLGLLFDNSAAHWRVSMPDAECFMYFVAHMNRLFGKGYTLYVEGKGLANDVLALYEAQAEAQPENIMPMLVDPRAQRLHVAMGPKLAKSMDHLASCKTYAQMGELCLVYRAGQVWLDGSRLGERLVRLHGDLKEAQIKAFAGGPLRGHWSWVPAQH